MRSSLAPMALLACLAGIPCFAQAVTLREALAATVRNHPGLRLQEQQVAASEAARLRASGIFDRRLQANAGQGRRYQPLGALERTVFGTNSVTANQTAAQASMTQLFRSGVSTAAVLDWSRLSDNNGARIGLNQSQFRVQVNVPLLRGKGSLVVAAAEKAAGRMVEAEAQTLRQTLASLLTDTAIAYWNAEAARRNLEVFTAAEKRGEAYRQTVETLIAADKLPAIEITQVEANLAVRLTARIAAEQQLLQANQELGLAMGDAAESLLSVRGAAERFPQRDRREISLPALVQQALETRGDVAAAGEMEQRAQDLAAAANNQVKPQLDLQWTTGYSGLREGLRIDRFPLALVSGVRGIDVQGGVTYDFAPRNRALKGAAAEAGIAAKQAALRKQDLARRVASSVIVAASAVRNAAAQVDAAQSSLKLAELALSNEREKLRLGSSSLVDVLTLEERYQSGLLTVVRAEADYAIALARLRLASGGIVQQQVSGAGSMEVDPEVFRTLPSPSPRTPSSSQEVPR